MIRRVSSPNFQPATTNYSPLAPFVRLLKGSQEPITLIEISYRRCLGKYFVRSCSPLVSLALQKGLARSVFKSSTAIG